MFYARFVVLYLSTTLFILSVAIQDKINSTTVPSTYCYKKSLLMNSLNSCKKDDYCCMYQVYETQFNNEHNGVVLPAYANNLNNCRYTCRNKLPPLNACTRAEPLFDNYRVLDNCYDTCFASAYNCPTVQNNYGSTADKNMLEIILVVIVLASFALCICRTTCFADFRIKSVRSSTPPSSKVHVAVTSDEHYYNV